MASKTRAPRLSLFPRVHLAPPPQQSGANVDPMKRSIPALPPAAGPSLPKKPGSWNWRCHYCHSVYRLGCTRRCLECGHDMCSGAKTESRRRVSRRKGPCVAEFDYAGWAAWGRWRRGEEGDHASGAREDMFVLRRHDCSAHCDFPSECMNTLHTAMVEGRADQIYTQAAVRSAADARLCVVEEGDEEDNEEWEGGEAKAVPTGPFELSAGEENFTTTAGEMDLGNFYYESDEDEEEEGESGEDNDEDEEEVHLYAPQETQERRSRAKLAQLTGLEPFGPFEEVSLGSPPSYAGEPSGPDESTAAAAASFYPITTYAGTAQHPGLDPSDITAIGPPAAGCYDEDLIELLKLRRA